MKRRKFLVGLAGIGSSASLILGSGAFSSVDARRTVSVATADDEDAFLALDPISDPGIGGDETGRAYTLADGTIAFSIPGVHLGESETAEGVGIDSIYKFPGLLQVTNKGTNSARLYSSYEGDKLADLALVNDNGVLKDDPPTLDVGDSIDVGLYIDTHDSAIGEFDETLTIIADQPDE